MECYPCPECGANIGEDEVYCPFCDVDIYGADNDGSDEED